MWEATPRKSAQVGGRQTPAVVPATPGRAQYPSTEGESLTVVHKYTVFVNPGASGKEPTYQCQRHIRSLGGEDPLEKGMATHSSIFAWKIP